MKHSPLTTHHSPSPGYADEHDAFLHHPQQHETQNQSVLRRSALATWGKLAVGAAVGVAAVSYCVNVQSSLTAQHATIALMQQQMCDRPLSLSLCAFLTHSHAVVLLGD